MLSSEPQSTITGTIYPQLTNPHTKAEGYLLEVTLADVSKMDVAADIITTTSLEIDALPASYSLKFNPEQLKERMTYALQARVKNKDGKLFAITDTSQQYHIKQDDSDYDILVKPLRLSSPDTKTARLNCDKSDYSLVFYPDLLVIRPQPSGSQRILPRVPSASGEKFQRVGDMVFMKGDKPPFVDLNEERLTCVIAK
jgi:hypothetical protein